eukprot:scpid97275/ scgid14840/ 
MQSPYVVFKLSSTPMLIILVLFKVSCIAWRSSADLLVPFKFLHRMALQWRMEVPRADDVVVATWQMSSTALVLDQPSCPISTRVCVWGSVCGWVLHAGRCDPPAGGERSKHSFSVCMCVCVFMC